MMLLKRVSLKALRLISPVLFSISLSLAVSTTASANSSTDMPILVIGASFENGNAPINDNLDSPLGGFAVGSGSYLSLGDALVRNKRLNGFVINEAQAGATTFDRQSCVGSTCTTPIWQGFDKQLQKALMRVMVADPQNPENVVFNTHYVLIGIPNDCLHSNAFGIPEVETQPCTQDDMNAMIDRIKDVAMQAIALDITPIIPLYPNFNDWDLALTQQLFGLQWMIGENDFNALKALQQSRLETEVPQAILVNAWKNFTHMGDGLHPDKKTSRKAAQRIVRAIKRYERGLMQ